MNKDIILIPIAIASYWGLKQLFGERNGTVLDFKNKIIAWIVSAIVVSFIFGTPYFGSKVPGSLFERAEYEGMFYVYLFPEGQKIKSYHIPAMVAATISESTYDETTYSSMMYRIRFAYYPNKNKIKFYNADAVIRLDEFTTLFDDNGSYWGIILTNRPYK